MSGFIRPSESGPPDENVAMSSALSASLSLTLQPSMPSFRAFSPAATEITFFAVLGEPTLPLGPALPAAKHIGIS